MMRLNPGHLAALLARGRLDQLATVTSLANKVTCTHISRLRHSLLYHAFITLSIVFWLTICVYSILVERACHFLVDTFSVSGV